MYELNKKLNLLAINFLVSPRDKICRMTPFFHKCIIGLKNGMSIIIESFSGPKGLNCNGDNK